MTKECNSARSFYRAPKAEWILADKIGDKRKRKLLRTGNYSDLVRKIARSLQIEYHARESCDTVTNYIRIVVRLKMPASLVDDFHNSRFGYRAQYYKGTKNGEQANLFAVNTLAPVILERLRGCLKPSCKREWVESSLAGRHAKIWIHQGKWLLEKRKSDRNLFARRWQMQNTSRFDKKCQKRHIWGSLTPKNERRLELKGAFVKPDGRVLKRDLKPKRGEHLWKLGFT